MWLPGAICSDIHEAVFTLIGTLLVKRVAVELVRLVVTVAPCRVFRTRPRGGAEWTAPTMGMRTT